MHDKLEPIGLSKREHFAALILGGMYANPDFTEMQFEAAATTAVGQADALLAVLNYSADVIEAQRLTVEEMTMNELRAEFYGDEILLGGIDLD